MQKLLKVMLLSTALAFSAVPASYAQVGNLSATEQATFDALPADLQDSLGTLGLPASELARILGNVARLSPASLQAISTLPVAQFAAMASLPAAQVDAVVGLPAAQRAAVIS